jgi:hypothetical protein
LGSLRERGFGPAASCAALLLGAVFLAIGAAFGLAPHFGARVFGIDSTDPGALAYVRAVSFRDLALALYIFGLVAFGTARSLSVVLACSLVIPALDLVLVWSVSGSAATAQLAVHLASGLVLLAMALWLRAGAAAPRS